VGIKHAINMGLLGQQRDRFHVYTEPRSLAERLDLLRAIPGYQGIEVIYPLEFREREARIGEIRASGWPVAAINLNVKADAKWRNGSFTSSDKGTRQAAIRDLKASMDLAAELGTDVVTCCTLIDGHNYAFQADYVAQWHWLVEGIREAARHRSDVRVALEYKSKESRKHCTLGDAGRALHLCHQAELDNVGVTFDVGHALIAGECPAAACALIADAGKLFYTHFNDNGTDWDWDMIPGSVFVWDLLETLYYLQRTDWSGWLSYDVVTRSGDDIVGVQVATMRVMQAAEKLLKKIGREQLDAMIARGAPHESVPALWEALL